MAGTTTVAREESAGPADPEGSRYTDCFNALSADCPSRRLLDTIGDKWVTLVLVALGWRSPMRYSELASRIEGVSQKMLTQTLRRLERDGLVTRTVTPSVPVRVDYAITPLGTSLVAVVGRLKVWAERHMTDVDAARAAYDEGR
ncbi:winged helix-turn-helix transcriptional regulator [Myceligenerans indicum]|uniref:Helix-turn-helix transcriptional regulator n=1 Tax=Myceligenerans indicum TaxID=2593663 RepID=A0ABS1LII1_9MICO|nr:helix-turn-helix domain-containing protein [Myceligenerans indicum]MBL0885968.1 helix-turn-helix transcriptional regulator [Myceligenerans indicum]